MSDAVVKVELNLAGLLGRYFSRLQRLFDISMFLKSGCAELQEGELRDLGTLMVFHLASGDRPPFEEMRAQADQWLLRGFFRDAMEHTGLFLDECLTACAFIELSARKKATGAELKQLLSVGPKKIHKLHLPQKLEKLERDYGIDSPLAAHILSMNKLRACVVHRLGVVSALDVDDSASLRVRWRTTRLTARGETSGHEVLLDRPGVHITEGSVIQLQFIDHEKAFALGEKIELSAEEVHACLVTFFHFGQSTAQLVEAFAKRLGLELREAAKNA